jgi:hypothetical protein
MGKLTPQCKTQIITLKNQIDLVNYHTSAISKTGQWPQEQRRNNASQDVQEKK